MSAFDTFVQAGGTGINLPGIVNQAQVAKQNDLLLLNAPKVEARAAAQENRLQNQENRLQNQWETIDQLRQGSRLLNYIDNESPDIKGAMAYISEGGVTEKEKPTLALFQKALESGDLSQVGELRNALIGLKKTALEMGDVKAQGGDGTAHMQDDAHLQALIRQYGVDSPRVQQFYDVLRQNYSWQNMGNVPTPARIGASGPQIGGQAPTQENPSGVDNRTPAQITMENARNVANAKETGTQQAQIDAIEPKAVNTEQANEIASRPQRRTNALSQKSKFNNLFVELDEANKNTNFWTTGNFGFASRWIAPGLSDASSLDSNLKSIRANLSVEAMAGLKALSPSGATGMGNQSDKEFGALESLVSTLEQLKQPKEIRRALNKVFEHITRLDQLSTVQVDLADGKISLDEAKQRSNDISLRPRLSGESGELNKRTILRLDNGAWIYRDTGEIVE